MVQALEAVVKVLIPEDFVLVTKIEYEKLKESEMKGEIGDMKWFKQLIGLSNDSIIKERILYPHRKELEEFVVYADGAAHWKFHKNATRDWVEKNFDKAVGRSKR